MMVHNLQRKIAIDVASIRTFAASLPSHISEVRTAEFSIAFISDRRMKQLNEMFRGKATTTDVLSFPNEPDDFPLTTDLRSPTTAFLGDIVISAEQAAKQAAENGLSHEAEIKQLILHGLLHLCGYDHETDDGEMNARELELRESLGI